MYSRKKILLLVILTPTINVFAMPERFQKAFKTLIPCCLTRAQSNPELTEDTINTENESEDLVHENPNLFFSSIEIKQYLKKIDERAKNLVSENPESLCQNYKYLLMKNNEFRNIMNMKTIAEWNNNKIMTLNNEDEKQRILKSMNSFDESKLYDLLSKKQERLPSEDQEKLLPEDRRNN